MTDKEITTCQICARAIKAKSGLIAHHGYKRPGGGWQTASCAGARHLPYEVSCDVLPPTITTIKNYITLKETQLNEFIANPPEILKVNVGGYYSTSTMNVSRPENFDPKKEICCHPFHSYEGQFQHNKHEIEQSIKLAKIDLEFMENRLANWIPPKK